MKKFSEKIISNFILVIKHLGDISTWGDEKWIQNFNRKT